MACSYFEQVSAALVDLDMEMLAPLAELLSRTRASGGAVWLAGNGGSFAAALHWAIDLQKAAELRAHVLGVNGGVLTAWSNDMSYADALAQDFVQLSRTGDCLVCLSCSGTSPNIIAVLQAAQRQGHPAMLLTSLHCPDRSVAAHCIVMPSYHYGVIEDCFGAIGHWLTEELSAR